MHHGAWPKKGIDHINGITDDNRISNLRDVSQSDNMRNMTTPCRNTSGRIGVYWFARDCKWQAQIRADGKTKHLGYFDDINDAIAARKAAEIEYGYHENHGRAPKC